MAPPPQTALGVRDGPQELSLLSQPTGSKAKSCREERRKNLGNPCGRRTEKVNGFGWVMEWRWLSKEHTLLAGNGEERKDEGARIHLKQINSSNFQVRKPRIKYDAEQH